MSTRKNADFEAVAVRLVPMVVCSRVIRSPGGMTATSFGAIAQLGERYNGIVEVSGSIPLGSTKSKPGGSPPGFFHVCGPFSGSG
jgi:hypothetical protein